ncbi:MAG: hypothetical protein KGL39_01195 [Patescibacteria group bacterium]|nr:hypothetical protein [Patescibacteria group bacterium]
MAAVETHEKKVAREKREKEIKEKHAAMKATASMILKTSERYNRYTNLSTKNALILDKFLIFVDVASTYFAMEMQNTDAPPDVREQVNKAIDQVRQDMQSLADQVDFPQLAPDEPFGKHVMQKAGAHYDQAATQEKKAT